MFNPFRIMCRAAMDSIPFFVLKDPNGHRHLNVRNRVLVSAGPTESGYDMVIWSGSSGSTVLEITIRDRWFEVSRSSRDGWRKDRWRLMESGATSFFDERDRFAFWSGGRQLVSVLGVEIREALAADEESAYAAWKAKDDARKAAEAQAPAGAN